MDGWTDRRMAGWMDGWTCNFMFFSTVFQAYQANVRVIMKDYVNTIIYIAGSCNSRKIPF